MFEFVRRCFQIDVFGFCSRKETKYVDFGAEDQGKVGVGFARKDPEWDADIDALTEMEYNLVAEQPKGIKLELHEQEAFENPKSEQVEKTDNEVINKTEKEEDMDVENHNELSDLISDDEDSNETDEKDDS
eukprot:gene6126-6830_t